jgi:hypothetical protein
LSEPRGYDLRYIKVPVYLFYGGNDAMVSQEVGICVLNFKSFVSFYSLQAVEKLLKELGSFRKRIFYVPRDNEKSPFNHLDFIMAKDVKKDLYDQIFRIMREQLSEVDIV